MAEDTDPLQPKFDAYADELVGHAVDAAREFLELDQAAVDRVVEAVFVALFEARIPLATLAFEETGLGVLEHKVQKNAWASLLVYEQLRERVTVGKLPRTADTGVDEWAFPRGPTLAITPVTNPTSTAIHNLLVAFKTRNPLIFSPHRGARKCVAEVARIAEEAAVAAGAPAYCAQIILKGNVGYTQAVMAHRGLAMILATGAQSIVTQAQAVGTPCVGVGAGNVPVYVHKSADLEAASRAIMHSKTYDNGVVCASEQLLIAEAEVADKLKKLMIADGAFFLDAEQTAAVGELAFDPYARTMTAQVVGQSASVIAERAGFGDALPPGTRLLVAPIDDIGPEHALSHEILAPILAWHIVPDHAAALAAALATLNLGGRGHTVALHARDEQVVEEIAAMMPAGRICINVPSTQGAVGGTHTRLLPSLSLGCGVGGRNVLLDNLGVDQLLEIHRVAPLELNTGWMAFSREDWMRETLNAEEALRQYRR